MPGKLILGFIFHFSVSLDICSYPLCLVVSISTNQVISEMCRLVIFNNPKESNIEMKGMDPSEK